MPTMTRKRAMNVPYKSKIRTPSGWVDVSLVDGVDVAEVEGVAAVAALMSVGFRISATAPENSAGAAEGSTPGPDAAGPAIGEPATSTGLPDTDPGTDPDTDPDSDPTRKAIADAIASGSIEDLREALRISVGAAEFTIESLTEAVEAFDGDLIEVEDLDALAAIEKSGRNRKGALVALDTLRDVLVAQG